MWRYIVAVCFALWLLVTWLLDWAGRVETAKHLFEKRGEIIATIGTFITWKWSPIIVFAVLLVIWLIVQHFPTFGSSTDSSVQTPAGIQQNANVSGGSTNIQAGGNVSNVTINPGVSEDTIRQLVNQKAVSAHALLTARYPKGYVILGIANGKIIYRSDNEPKNLQVDWESAEIKINKEKNEVWIRMPDFSMIGLRMKNIKVAILYQNGAMGGLAQINDNDLKAEVLDADSGILVVGMK